MSRRSTSPTSRARCPTWDAPDQRRLRHAVPENRLRLYDMRAIIDTIADTDSVLELRAKFGIGIITAFIRVEGRPMGVIANNPASPGRRDRLRRRRQGRALHAALRRLRHSRAEPDRLPRHHGRPGSRTDGAGPPLHAPVQRGRQHDRAAVHRHRPQGLRSRRPGDVRRGHPGRLLRRGLAHRRVRRHEHRRRGQARLPQGADGDRGPRGEARGVPAPDRDGLRQSQGGQRRGRRRDRRRDRSRRTRATGSPAA